VVSTELPIGKKEVRRGGLLVEVVLERELEGAAQQRVGFVHVAATERHRRLGAEGEGDRLRKAVCLGDVERLLRPHGGPLQVALEPVAASQRRRDQGDVLVRLVARDDLEGAFEARDRLVARFRDPEGPMLLLSGESGGEGRNFQFAHHLVLFDLPLNPSLVEQRIGRLDRIGQAETIKIHVPVLSGGADAAVAEWYHFGLNAFEAPLHGGNDYANAFRTRLLELAVAYGEGKLKKNARKTLDAFITETEKFRDELQLKMKQGRDRLLELNSFNRDAAKRVIDRVRAADADPFLKKILTDLLDHFGVRIGEHEDGDVTLDASHAYVEGFPSIPRDGMLATYDRKRAIAREDIRFISADHPLVQDSIDLLVNSPAGTTSFCVLEADKPNLLLEAVFVLEAVADAKWHVDQFLAPTPVRVLVDIHGNDLTENVLYSRLAADVEDAPLPRFLEKPAFNGTLLKNLVEAANDRAKAHTLTLKKTARERAAAVLTADLQRLVDLSKLNDNVRPEEIELAKKQVLQVRTAIEQARLRLDSLRLIVEGVEVD